MASTTVDAVIAAPRDVVYRLFADRESISPYLPVQVKLTKPGLTEREGVGAQHIVGLGPLGITEEITKLVPGERMEYKIVKGAPVKRHVGIVTFADTDNGTLVSYNGVRPHTPRARQGAGVRPEEPDRPVHQGRAEGRALIDAITASLPRCPTSRHAP